MDHQWILTWTSYIVFNILSERVRKALMSRTECRYCSISTLNLIRLFGIFSTTDYARTPSQLKAVSKKGVSSLWHTLASSHCCFALPSGSLRMASSSTAGVTEASSTWHTGLWARMKARKVLIRSFFLKMPLPLLLTLRIHYSGSSPALLVAQETAGTNSMLTCSNYSRPCFSRIRLYSHSRCNSTTD